jgi:hypothetical protein
VENSAPEPQVGARLYQLTDYRRATAIELPADRVGLVAFLRNLADTIEAEGAV